ncbi:hypothetical protein ACQ4LE_007151 [Meloidogyne hapla]
MDNCWNDPRIRSRQKSDFVQKFDNFKANPRAMSLKKYNETLQQMGGFGSACHVQSVYNVTNQRGVDGRFVLRLVELKSGKTVVPLEDVFDEIERIHLQHNHLCNISKFYQVLKDATNFAIGNISFEMAKDFISRCQTCTINSQQKRQPLQTTGLFAPPKLDSTTLPKATNTPDASLLSNGTSTSYGSGQNAVMNCSKNGSTNIDHNFVKPSQPSFVAPSPIYTSVCRPQFSSTPIGNPAFSSFTSSSQNCISKAGWMPTFTSTPLATKSAQRRIVTSTPIFSPNFQPLQNTITPQMANCVNNQTVTSGPRETLIPNPFTPSTVVISDDVTREVVNIEPERNALITQAEVKQELQTIDYMLQKYIESGEWKNDFIFTDMECRQIIGDLAKNHFGMWELKESRTNPREYYFFNKKDGKCQWNEPDEWVEEIKKKVSREKILRIEEEANNQLEDVDDIIEQPLQEDNIVEDPIQTEQKKDEEIVQGWKFKLNLRFTLTEPAKKVVAKKVVEDPKQKEDLQKKDDEVVQPAEPVKDLIGENDNIDKNSSENQLPQNLDPLPAETLNMTPTCSSAIIEQPVKESESVDVPIQQEHLANKDSSESIFLRPFNTTESFMAAALDGGLNDETMDIANFIEQFDEQLNSPVNSPVNNSQVVQSKEINDEIVIEKVSEEEVNKNIAPIKSNQTAKKTVGGPSFYQFSMTGQKRLNEALKIKKEVKTPYKKRPPVFKHVALQRVRITLPDVEKLFTEPQMDCQKLKKAIKDLEDKILASNQKGHQFSTSLPSSSSTAKKKRPMAKKYSKNINDVCSTSTSTATNNRRSRSSNNSQKNVQKKFKKSDSPDTSPFFHPYTRRSSTPFVGKDVQLFICIHCPAGSHSKYTNENDYRLHVLARHRIVTDDSEAIHDYIKKQRYNYVGNLSFHCEECDKYYDNQQQNSFERAADWIDHRLKIHGKECEENCANILEKIYASPTHHPFLTIKKEKEEVLSDNEEDIEWKANKKNKDNAFDPSPKKINKRKKKKRSSGTNNKYVRVKKEVIN